MSNILLYFKLQALILHPSPPRCENIGFDPPPPLLYITFLLGLSASVLAGGTWKSISTGPKVAANGKNPALTHPPGERAIPACM